MCTPLLFSPLLFACRLRMSSSRVVFACRSLRRYLNLCNFSLIALGMGLTMMFSLQFGVKGATWGGSAVCGVVVMTFCMWIIFDIQAMQIDLTADEYGERERETETER